jgi:hypothetical protein
MTRVEKTVFLSYRRTNAPWALAIYQNLTANGFDVFFDYTGIASGDFESVILEKYKGKSAFSCRPNAISLGALRGSRRPAAAGD